MGVLPGHSEPVMNALDAVTPIGETPTGAAIRGACSYASAWKTQHPRDEVVILMVTDGKPEAPVSCRPQAGSCCPTIADAEAAATACLTGEPTIKSYVLGVGPNLQNLHQIAAAAGTKKAYLVEEGDVSARVLDALNAIRGDALPCDFSLPPAPQGQTLAYERVNVAYASAGCEGTVFYHVASASDCGSQDAWYYDNPAQPSRVSFCPRACELVSASPGQLLFSVGCTTVDAIR